MIVIDIAIGLVLIYFLYSLLSSIIAEIISSWLGMRARMLRQGVDNILNDKLIGNSRDFLKWLKDIFLVEDKNFKYTIAGKFYEEPSIKYLAKPGEHVWYSIRNRKPAYISPENFVITVLNMLSNKGRGISEWDKIKFAIETNALHLDPETLKMLRDLVKRADDSFDNFVNLLQNYFADTMDRVNGWYKRKIGSIIFFIGLIMCTIFNVDTIQIVKTLSNSKEKRLQMIELADKVVIQKSEIDELMTKQDTLDELKYKMQAHGLVKDDILQANDIVAVGWKFKIVRREANICISDSGLCFGGINNTNIKLINLHKKTIDSLSTVKNDLEKQISKLDTIQASIKKIYVNRQKINVIQDSIYTHTVAISEITGLNFTQYDSIVTNKANVKIIGKGYPTLSKKVAIVIKAMTPWKSTFWGIIITALALTLGAQFWFDLLKKLISIRSAGKKPEENEVGKKQLAGLKLKGETITSKDPVEIVITENRAYWEGLPGVLGINLSKNPNSIQIIAENPALIKGHIENPTITNDNLHSVDIEMIQGEKAVLLDNERGYIYTKNKDARGTIAGIFLNLKSNSKCYLTCAHVVQKFDYGYFDVDDSDVKITDQQNTIGNVRNLIASSFIDAAVIDFKTNTIPPKYGVENVSRIADLNKLSYDHQNNIYFKSEAYEHPVSGILAMSRFDYTFDNNKYMYDLYLIEHSNEIFSDGGDSGALLYVHQIPTDQNSKKIAIGILIGSGMIDGKKYTLGIGIQEICDSLAIKPIRNN